MSQGLSNVSSSNVTLAAKGNGGGGGGGGKGKPTPPPEPETPSYTFKYVYVLGDSLVDSGNALKLAEFYDDLPFQSLPEGAPTAELGYFDGRFSDGYTYVDLLANKYVGEPTEDVFPFGYKYEGIPIAPFASDPDGVSLNFAYGGAQIIQGSEAVSDLDNQTDALRDAVDKNFDPNSLILVTIGGNDVRELAPATGVPADWATAKADLLDSANEMYRELLELVEEGATEIMITGIPDVGIIPRYDINENGVLDGDEIVRAEAATEYSAFLNQLIEGQLVGLLEKAGANVTFVNLSSFDATDSANYPITPTEGVLELVFPTLEGLNDLPPGTIESDILQYQDLIFFDDVHPTAQVHALVASYIHSELTGDPYIEIMPMDAADVVFAQAGTISAVGEVDAVTVTLTKGVSYTIDVLGVASLGIGTALGDPMLTITDFRGKAVGGFDPLSGNDNGLGFDAHFVFTPEKSGDYTLHIGAEGALTGTYVVQVGVVGASAATSLASANDNLRTSDMSVAMMSAAAVGLASYETVAFDAGGISGNVLQARAMLSSETSFHATPTELVSFDMELGGFASSHHAGGKTPAGATLQSALDHSPPGLVELDSGSTPEQLVELSAKSGLLVDMIQTSNAASGEQMMAALALAEVAQAVGSSEAGDTAQLAEALSELVDETAVDAIVDAFGEGEISPDSQQAVGDIADLLDLAIEPGAGPIAAMPVIDLLMVAEGDTASA